MSFHNWLQSVRSVLAPRRGQRKHGLRRSLRAATHWLNVEALEDRLTPSFTWAGDFPGGIWGTGSATGSATADFNHDGYTDTVSCENNTNTLILQLSKSDGTFGDPRTVANGVFKVEVGDFTSDGIPDLLVLGSYGLSVLPGHGDGTFAASISSDGTGLAGWMTVADFNSDGQPDVFLAFQGWDFGGYGNVWLGAGNGSFVAQPGGIGSDSDNFAYAIGDFNGDARPDVAWNHVDIDLYEWVGTEYLNAGDWGLSGPYLSLSDPMVTEGNSGTTNANFTLTLAQASNVDLSFNYNTSDGTATAGSDYQAASGTLTIPAGQTTGTISVQVNGDSLPEPDESFSVNLSREHWSGVTIGYGTGTIEDDEPHISISDVNATEGNTGTRAASFTVNLSEPSEQTVTVDFTTAAGSASANSDYFSTSGTVTFAPGETNKPIAVLVNGDRNGEFNESFSVNLSGATNAIIVDSEGVGTITDDEPRISITPSMSHSEGNTGPTPFAFAVNLSSAYDVPVTVDWAPADDTATAGSDYQAASGTLTIPAGQTTGTINVLVNGDRLPELKETLFVNLSGATSAVIISGHSVGTIIDDEPRISISDVSKKEGKKNQTTLFTFTVTLSAAYDQAVTMSFQTVNGTATTSDNDYIAKSGTLTFAPGETSKTITIEVKGDSKQETNETFYLDLSALSSNGLFTKSRGVGTILNDD